MIIPSMLLYSSNWGKVSTFRMMPVMLDCPFAECIYDPNSKNLVVISKVPTELFHMVEKLDDNGDAMPIKGKPRPNGKNFKEERRAIPSYQEYYIGEMNEILNFVASFATNASAFDVSPYMVPSDVKSKTESVIETNPVTEVKPPEIKTPVLDVVK